MAGKGKRGSGAVDPQSELKQVMETALSANLQREKQELKAQLVARESQLEQARKDIADLKIQLNTAEREAAAAGGLLTERATALEDERQRHAQELEAVRAEIAGERAAWKSRSAELDERERAIKAREDAEAALAAKREEHEKKIAAMQVEHSRLLAEAEAARRFAADTRALIDEELNQLSDKAKVIADDKARVAKLDQELSSRRSEVDATQRVLSERDAALSAREKTAEELIAQANEEYLRAEATRVDREQRERDLTAREKAHALAVGDVHAQKELQARSVAFMMRMKEQLIAETAAHNQAVEELRAGKAAFELERAAWIAEAEARTRQAEADERNARASAIAESERRCKDLEARANEQYEAHLSLAQERARDLEAAARKTHDDLIAKALEEDKRRREAFEKERAEMEKSTAEEAVRRLERAAAEAVRIESDAAKVRADLEAQRAEHDRLVSEARERGQALELERQETAVLRETVDRRKKQLQQHIEEEAEVRVRTVRSELDAEKARGEKLQQMLRVEAQERTRLEALITGSGGETVPRLKLQLDEARGRVAELEQAMRSVPREEDLRRLRERADAAEAIERQKNALQVRITQLNEQLQSAEGQRVMLDGERRIADTYRATNQALRNELDHLKVLVDQQVANPLRAFAEVHANVDLPKGNITRPRSLGDLALRARYRMAALPKGRARYYDERVVATALGSLAATRTLLLEGKSGTGKTSLLVALAEAIGATCEVIEVQSQWRDRGDLVGSYNPFHKRFYAAPFALALYKAGLSGFRERPFFIVLDELNLSHVEHYFADVLSLLERDPKDHRIRLVEDPEALDRAPFTEGLVRDPRYGWSLGIPLNVWFIGTANRDESTRPISDKVYDRAATIELNKRAKSFDPQPEFELLDPVGFEDLRGLFDTAPSAAEPELKPVSDYLDEVVHELETQFRITRTNRFDNQWRRFVPVYLASHPDTKTAGERQQRLGEALDHFLATKLLRSLKDRFDPNLEEMLTELRDKTLPALWDDAWGPFEDTHSHALVDGQLQKRRGR